MAGPQEIKLFGKWSYDDVEVYSRATRLTLFELLNASAYFSNWLRS